MELLLESVQAKRKVSTEILNGVPFEDRHLLAWHLDMLTKDEVEAILEAQESTSNVMGHKIKLRVDTNQISANEPNEDYMSWGAIQPTKENPSLYMFGLYDGHVGRWCAEQVAARIGPMLDTSLEIIDQMANSIAVSKTTSDNSSLQAIISRLQHEEGLNWDHMSLALTATFLSLDHELVFGALAKYRKLQDITKMEELLGPALSGSCGIVAVVDTKANEVVVANAGDSRAILGMRLNDGSWKAVRLSEDQTCTNENELMRLSSEHPGETSSIIVNGRVFGGMVVTRAFGDCKYKWPVEVQNEIFPSMYSQGYIRAETSPACLTPPYVTAKPELVRHKLDENDKFIVVASDGIYDRLLDKEVVETVAQWYEANQEKSETKVTQDKNAATHLIRSALEVDMLNMSEYKNTTIRKLLAIPSPQSRRYYDDLSVTVISFDRDQQ
ncbi:hypothetical protein GGI25_000002 [Coemansia spiralis]|uniref:PPM-type phosphatase domain-containing protein n=2 Tax=Coemansia TaxID=4863 RepID=A0A9W8GD25_9FUNG|nr:hypothetical protein EDC05_004424 [Coemansia umbellata]KAJ2623122.1 hypothetical protein GGI26_002733 [Coemansia sp. RSA 1358]KAJ2681049.1 hypothetical protein GGI25_000002 [Coemansia spiralis]